MKDFSQIRKNLKKDFSGLKAIKVAVLGDTSTQFLAQAIRGMGYESGYDLQLYEADFNQIALQVNDPHSGLYAFDPAVVIVFQSSHALLQQYNKLPVEQHSGLAQNELDAIANTYEIIRQRLNAKVVFYNYTEIDDAVFGNFANKTDSSFLYQLRKLNFKLMEFAVSHADFFVCDLSAIQNRVGKPNVFKTSVYISTEMVLGIDVLPEITSKTISLIQAFDGKSKKCLILDLDNTLWGGIIGDDGIENIQIGSLGIGKAFSEFQYWIKKLKGRGIIIAVCSKNTESVAREVFEKHPEMVLKMDDIAVFQVNWENKADNIRQIQRILNIGFDSMVFLDDNPFERNMVRENLPEVTVPELPEDPAEYLEFLYGQHLFETISLSEEDKERTKLYQSNAQRQSQMQRFTNEADFLKSLHMVSEVRAFNAFNLPRVSQLSQRSNQFNLRTVRYTEDALQKLSGSEDYFTFAFTLSDKFGHNGLIAAVILKKQGQQSLFIDTWFMSCRVLKRGMEQFVLNVLIDFANENGFSMLIGQYIETAKNAIVAAHYENLGFEKAGGFWNLNTPTAHKQETYIDKT